MNKKLWIILILLFVSITAIGVDTNTSISRFYEKSTITQLSVTKNVIKPGLSSVQTTTIKTSDLNEIANIVSKLKEMRQIKIRSVSNSVKTNSTERTEIIVILNAKNGMSLAYRFSSEGSSEVIRNNDKSYSTLFLIGQNPNSLVEYFDKLLISKMTDSKWIQ